MSPDPDSGSYDTGNPQSFNRYSYVLNNPINMTDPLGLDTTCVNGVVKDSNGTVIGGSTGSCKSKDDDDGPVWYDPFSWFSGWGGPSFHGSLKPRPNITCQQLAAGQVPSGNFSTWWAGYTNASSMLDNWLAGTGPTNTGFGPGSPESQQMMGAYGLAGNVKAFLAGGPSAGFQNFGLSGLVGSGLNPTAQFVGSYGWNMSLSGGYLNITLKNATTMYSAFYHAPGLNPNPPTLGDSVFNPGRHPMSRVNQVFHIQVPCS
jgi:hypothetical protein